MLTLYQFPISHYCEKVRWALDFKQLAYQKKNLLPGPHLRAMRRLAPKSSVPVLRDGDRAVQGSREIVDYCEQAFPERSLTPEDPALAKESASWEAYVDEELGVHVRRAAYHVLLEHKEVVLPFFTHQGPWYGKLLMGAIFPKLRRLMRQAMDINEQTALESMQRTEAALDKIAARLSDREFLVGDTFSRADLAAAALAAPMFRPAAYGLPWPDRWPQEMEDWIESNAERLVWAERLYDNHRLADTVDSAA